MASPASYDEHVYALTFVWIAYYIGEDVNSDKIILIKPNEPWPN